MKKKAYLQDTTLQADAIRQIYKRYTWRYTRSRISLADGSIELVDEKIFPGARFVSAVQTFEYAKYLYLQRKARLCDELGSAPLEPRYLFTLELQDVDRPLHVICLYSDKL